MASISDRFRDYLNGIAPFNPAVHRFSHPALNSTYGIELEFFSSANRYDLANRVNSCMFTQNIASWRINYDANGRTITGNNPTNFDEWSAYFLEASEGYHAKSVKGDATCQNKGTAGGRIENDSSVTLNEQLGITLWSKRLGDDLVETDVKTGNALKPEFAGLTQGAIRVTPSSRQYSLPNPAVNPWNPNGLRGFFQQNELVTNILFNHYGEYPFMRSGNTFQQGLVPAGSLMVDNILNHMTAHAIVLATQNFGFHVHLSEYPRIDNPEARTAMLIGFIKLYFAFEPMLFAMHPPYRSESTWCQNLHTIFTFGEVRNNTIRLLDDLLGNVTTNYTSIPISGVNRKVRGERYLALNLKNCVPGGIGTIEVRLGHCSFDSTFIQAYVNVLQTLMSFNLFMLDEDRRGNRPIFTAHNDVLDAIYNLPDRPEYFALTGNQFNDRLQRPAAGQPDNVPRRPIEGYFEYYARAKAVSTRFIIALIRAFVLNTDSYDAINALIPFINLYHTNTNNWLSKQNLNAILNPIPQASQYNVFRPVLLGTEYAINRNADGTFKTNVLHRCKTCSETPQGQCRAAFNNGAPPVKVNTPERPVGGPARLAAHRDQSRVYNLRCVENGYYVDLRGKTQTELINAKLYGGKRTNGMTGSGSPTPFVLDMKTDVITTSPLPEQTGEDYSMKNYQEVCKINMGAAVIQLREKKDGSFDVGYSDWVGGFIPDKQLTAIVTTLLNNKILDRKTLDILIENRYIDFYVFTTNTELHNKKLMEELGKFNIQPETIEKIRMVYLNRQVAGRKTRGHKKQRKRKTFRNKKI